MFKRHFKQVLTTALSNEINENKNLRKSSLFQHLIEAKLTKTIGLRTIILIHAKMQRIRTETKTLKNKKSIS